MNDFFLKIISILFYLFFSFIFFQALLKVIMLPKNQELLLLHLSHPRRHRRPRRIKIRINPGYNNPNPGCSSSNFLPFKHPNPPAKTVAS
jgi:hypothetical protein